MKLPISLLALALSFSAQSATKPNIVFILADDLGYTDVGCYGSKYYETPNIDRLATQGIRFTSGQTCGPNCQPTRAALMSGQYMPRTGVYTARGINMEKEGVAPDVLVAEHPDQLARGEDPQLDRAVEVLRAAGIEV